MKIHLMYGKDGIGIEIPSARAKVVRPQFVPGLEDEAAGFHAACREPIGCDSLRMKIRPGDNVAVVIPDGTRALPSGRLLGWLFDELDFLPPDRFTIILGTGTHRPNTTDEIREIVGEDIARDYKVVNHSAFDADTLADTGFVNDRGIPLWMNKEYVEADKRILMGFIEPHFMAGFSGGYKAVFPGVADIDSILDYHRAEMIGDPGSTWGSLENNPTQDAIRAHGSALPVDFLVNVTLNHQIDITGFFCGDVIEAHEAGSVFAKETAMAACERSYPLVITTNSGYPLDQNLYQSVKGMVAAAEIVDQGGEIILAAACNDGFPAHGNFARLIREHDSPQAMLDTVHQPGFRMLDQWQIQKLAQVQMKANVAVYSEIPPEEIQKASFTPITDLNAYIQDRLAALGNEPVAVLPEGPLTIPYL